jgi:prepilin-type N-terminal cleavage/methylation domain-containing protein
MRLRHEHLNFGGGRAEPFRAGKGFTLIELILVMAILTIAVSITAPTLANFFRGRTLDSEARRLLALTRQAQSRAVSEGIPMELWVDASQNKYGLEAEPSYEPDDAKKEEFVLDKNLGLKVVSLNIGASRANGSFGPSANAAPPAVVSHHPDVPRIRFLPDGSISEDSPQVVQLMGLEGNLISLTLSRSRLTYELQSPAN